MFLSKRVSARLKRVYVGIAMGFAIWLLYTSYLVLSNAISVKALPSGIELVLTPITPNQK
jgi:hypothetical protein